VPKYEKFNYRLNYLELSILEKFDDSRYRYRAINKIALESGEEKEIIRAKLNNLLSKGLVDLVSRPTGKKWIITNAGKEYIEYYYHELDESSG
jgi:hypothetical protein